jgi:hypothetical protein
VNDDGIDGDLEAGDGIYSGFLPEILQYPSDETCVLLATLSSGGSTDLSASSAPCNERLFSSGLE